MERYLKKLLTMIEIGDRLAPLSMCKRQSVSAIVFPVDCSAVYSIGYNGPAKGISNFSCSGKEGECGCIHAEMNAIAKYSNDTSKPSIISITASPCIICAGLILNCSNIVGVVFKNSYRRREGIELILDTEVSIIERSNLTLEKSRQSLVRWKSLC